MPRRNENARSRGFGDNRIWSNADLKAMSEHLDRKESQGRPNRNINPPKYDVVSEGYNPKSILRTTGESIVREHRNSIANLIHTPSIQRVYKAPWYKVINLNAVFEWTCWIAVAIALGLIFGLIVFGPFTVKEFWK